MRHITLADGRRWHVVSPHDAALEAAAHERQQAYFGGDTRIALRPGDVVLDVGANVGAFARMAAEAVGCSGRVVCYEPVPAAAEALALNAAALAAADAAAGPGCRRRAPIQTVCAALGASDGFAHVTFFPRCAALSTLFRDDEDALRATYSLLRHGGAGLPRPLAALAAAAAAAAPGLFWAVQRRIGGALLLRGAAELPCRVLATSTALAAALPPGGRLALLKINVERAEADVLLGVSAADWRRIDAVAAQVHDAHGRAAWAAALLTRVGGFDDVRVARESRFADCSLVMVYATRLGRRQ
jgi:FkbM family methyltransferase